jgi:hypothetical protein
MKRRNLTYFLSITKIPPFHQEKKSLRVTYHLEFKALYKQKEEKMAQSIQQGRTVAVDNSSMEAEGRLREEASVESLLLFNIERECSRADSAADLPNDFALTSVAAVIPKYFP